MSKGSPAMRKHSRALQGMFALAAAIYLGVMTVSGAMPRQKQLVEYAARGVLQTDPHEITRISLTQEGATFDVARDPGGAWRNQADGAPLSPRAASHLDTALQIMHASAPVKIMEAAELAGADTQSFGLDDGAAAVVLYRGQQPLLRLRFGRLNPEGYLQYMRADDAARVYLMSRFVGEEWKQSVEALGAPGPQTRT